MEETEDSCSRVSKRSGTIVETLGDPITCYCREPLLTLMSQLTKHVDDQGLEDTSNLNTGCFVAMALFLLLVGRWGDGVPVLFGHRSEDADLETNGRAFVIASDHIASIRRSCFLSSGSTCCCSTTSGRAVKPAR